MNTPLAADTFQGVLPRLIYLTITNNEITSLPRTLFNNMSRLLDLNLRGNWLRAIPDGAFAGSVWLRKLLLQRGLRTLARAQLLQRTCRGTSCSPFDISIYG